jgi:hypothetical protein
MKLTLHEAITIVLKTQPKRTATTEYIAEEINKLKLYTKKDKSPVLKGQIRLRTKLSNGKYHHLFDFNEPNIVKLKINEKEKSNSRGLSPELINELNTGFLKPILDLVKRDDTLCLKIRKEYFNIYYRGGSILKIENKNTWIHASFDTAYLKKQDGIKVESILKSLPKIIKTTDAAEKWVTSIPQLKQVFDEYFSKYAKSEREFQQLVARENNSSIISNDTDYFITDIEYTSSDSRNCRFDLVGIKWESSASNRKKKDNCRLVLIEMKYGDNALGGKAGIKKHLKDVDQFCGNEIQLKGLEAETLKCFEQLRELHLVRFGRNGNTHKITSFKNKKPEFILLLANHKPVKSKLEIELKDIKELDHADLKIATASFMGYGLYDKNMLTLDNFKKLNLELFPLETIN